MAAKKSGPQAILDRARKVAEEARKRAEPVAKRVGDAAKKAPVPKVARDVAKRIEPAAKRAGEMVGGALERAREIPKRLQRGSSGGRSKSSGSRSPSKKK